MNDTLSNLELELGLKPEPAATVVTPQSAWSPPLQARKSLKLELPKAKQCELPLESGPRRLCIGQAGGVAFDSLAELTGDRRRESLRERSFTLNPRF